VRATLANLETNRGAIASQRSWWSFRRVAPQVVAGPSEVAVKKVVAPTVQPQDIAEDDVVTPKGEFAALRLCDRFEPRLREWQDHGWRVASRCLPIG
jgi:hypothetical protein